MLAWFLALYSESPGPLLRPPEGDRPRDDPGEAAEEARALLAAVAEELVDGADLVRGRGRARVVVWLRHAVLQEDLRGAVRELAVDDHNLARFDLAVQRAHGLLDGVAEAEALDEDLARLAEPMNAARRLRLGRGVEGRLHQVDAVGGGQRDADRGGAVRDDEDARLGLARLNALEVLDQLVAAERLRVLVELEHRQPGKHAIAARLLPKEAHQVLLRAVLLGKDDAAHRWLDLAQALEVGEERRKLGRARVGHVRLHLLGRLCVLLQALLGQLLLALLTRALAGVERRRGDRIASRSVEGRRPSPRRTTRAATARPPCARPAPCARGSGGR